MNEAPADLRHSVGIPDAETERLHVRPADAIQEIIDRYAIAGANLLQWITPEDEKSMPRPRQRVAGLPIFPPSTTEWRDWASDVACRAAFQALREAKDAVKALAAQPRDDVRELLQDLEMCRDLMQEAKGHEGPNGGFVTNHLDDAENWLDKVRTRIEALSQTDEQPAIPDMTDAECATAYRDLRKRANDAGFATVGEWIDEQPDTDGLADEARLEAYQALQEMENIARTKAVDHVELGKRIVALRRALAEGAGK